jgi:hypothetical protein
MQHSPASSHLGPNILLISLFSNTFNLYSSDNVKDQVPHPHKTKDKLIVLYIAIFMFSDRREEDKRF